MGGDNYLLWSLIAALAAAALLLARRRGCGRGVPASAEAERPLAQVEGADAQVGVHAGVKYWVYLEDDSVRVEIETGADKGPPFASDSRHGREGLPADARAGDVRELLRLGAALVEAPAEADLLAARFPREKLDANAGTGFPAKFDEGALGRIVELLAAVRDKGMAGSCAGK